MRRVAGFTLVELVMVIVILSVVSLVSVRFIQLSMQGAIDTANRQQLGMTAGIVSERVSRALRGALPGSIRVSGDERCIEFIPIRGGSRYRNIPTKNPASSFQAVAAGTGQAATGRVVVYPYAGDVYNPGSPGVISAQTATLPEGSGTVTVNFSSGSHEFVDDSPMKRFYIVGEPIAFQQETGSRFLYRYSGYGFQSSVCSGLPGSFSASGASREVVAAPLEPDSLSFDFVPPSLTRNGVVTLSLTLASDVSSESIGVSQEVQIQNVP